MHVAPIGLTETIAKVQGNRQALTCYLNACCDRIEAHDPELQALLPDPRRRARLLTESHDPYHVMRDVLNASPVGVKDIFRVDHFETRAGSALPPELFAGAEASCVTALRRAGALILGKTVTTEFAYFEPGPTRNPHRTTHTPGGSSSGSAAAVAAGYCPLALGSQTSGSVIRPAAFCGVAGFKPTYGRIPIDGVIPYAPSFDTVGFFTRDARGLALAASLLCDAWRPTAAEATEEALPTLGIPVGPYLAQASPEALAAFAQQVARLEAAGFPVRRLNALEDIAAITTRHNRLAAAEMAQVHAAWFAEHATRYRPRTAALIREGQTVTAEEIAAARAGQATVRQELETLMAEHGIRAWICPAATGPAPERLASTGDPAMNLVWTHAGMPALTLPAGTAPNGLPLGLQCVAAVGEDEWLVALAVRIEPWLHVQR